MNVLLLTGAGISAESGLQTFRGTDGLWEGHKIEDVATPEAWQKNDKMVQKFYNQRRKAVLEAEPNAAHIALAELQQLHEVYIVTQNIDDLHERAGSKQVLHLHGEITKARSTANPDLVYDIEGWELKMGQTCELGSQLRPHIVWFGEAVPLMETAIAMAEQADLFVVVGTSLLVYPAAGLVNYAPPNAKVVVIDPASKEMRLQRKDVISIAMPATTGVPYFINEVLPNLV
jgi:NAD-dependent deacetylase